MNPVRIVCFLLLFISLRLAAQTDGLFRTERLGTRDGLSHRWTMCALQDSEGFGNLTLFPNSHGFQAVVTGGL